MAKIKRRLKLYATAPQRYRRSRGFGIHSPFAYTFVLRVLREPLPYYEYVAIGERRALAASLAHTVEGRRPKLISMKSAKMLFRIVCHFQPAAMLQLGTSYGVSTTALLDVSSTARMVIYKGADAHDEVYAAVTRQYGGRIAPQATLAAALAAYAELTATADSAPFVLVNALDTAADVAPCADALLHALAAGGTVVVRNLMRSPLTVALLAAIDRGLDHGMTFTNGRMAVIVGLRHLPRQRYSLWF